MHNALVSQTLSETVVLGDRENFNLARARGQGNKLFQVCLPQKAKVERFYVARD